MIAISARRSTVDLLIGCASLAVNLGGFDELFGELNRPLVLNGHDGELYAGSFKLLLQELSEPGLGSMVFAECLMKQIVILMLRQHVHEYGAESPLLALLGDSRLIRAVADVITHPEKALCRCLACNRGGNEPLGLRDLFRRTLRPNSDAIRPICPDAFCCAASAHLRDLDQMPSSGSRLF